MIRQLLIFTDDKLYSSLLLVDYGLKAMTKNVSAIRLYLLAASRGWAGRKGELICSELVGRDAADR